MINLGNLMASSDRGVKTKLRSGLLVDKDSPVLEVLGSIEELASVLGLVGVFSASKPMQDLAEEVGAGLSELAVGLSETGRLDMPHRHITFLEDYRKLPLDSKVDAVISREARAFARLAASVARRTERRMCTLMDLHSSASGLSDYTGSFTGSFGSPQNGLAFINLLGNLLDELASA